MSEKPRRLNVAAYFSRGWIFRLCLLAASFSAALSPLASQENESFYRWLAAANSDSTLSIEERFAALQKYHHDHPDDERACLVLLEWYLIHGKLSQAIKYFRDQVRYPFHQGHANWMLAKLYTVTDHPDSARQCYSAALQQQDRPPVELILEILTFERLYGGKSPPPILSPGPSPDPLLQKLLRGLSSYRGFNYQEAISSLMHLPPEVRNTAPLIDVLGDCYLHLPEGRSKADSIWQAGLQDAREQQDWYYEALFLERLGILAHYRSRYQDALNYYQSSGVLAGKIGSYFLMQLSLGNTATTLRFQGKYSRAAITYKKAIAIAAKLGDTSSLSLWYFGLGQTFYNLEQYSDALAAYDASIGFSTILGNIDRVIRAEYGKGDIYKNLNQFELARIVYRKVYLLAQDRGFPVLQTTAKRKLADLMKHHKRYEDAINIYNEALAASRLQLERCYIQKQLADIYRVQDNYALAARYYLRALEIARQANYPSYIGYCSSALARLEILKDNLGEAERYLQSALQIAIDQDISDLYIEVMQGWGDLYTRETRYRKAISCYRKATEMSEKSYENLQVEQFRIGFFSEAVSLYKKLTNAYYRRYRQSVSAGDLDSLLYYVEMSRARTLKDLLFRGNSSPYQLADTTAFAAYEKLKAVLKTQQRQLRLLFTDKALPQQRDSLFREIELTRHSLLAQRLRLLKSWPSRPLLQQISPDWSLSSLTKKLKQRNLGMLVYHISRESSFVIAVTPAKVEIVPLAIDPAELDLQIAALLEPLHHAEKYRFIQTPFRAEIAHRLYRQLVEPVEVALTLPERLLIIPEINLMNLPFELLLTRQPDRPDYLPTEKADYAKYFLQHRHNFVYSPAIGLPAENSPAFTHLFHSPELVVFANPITKFASLSLSSPGQNKALPDRQGKPSAPSFLPGTSAPRGVEWRFNPLLFSEVEAESIRTIYPSARIYKRAEATRETFLSTASACDIIHIATHGFIDEEFDAFSGLVFALGDDIDEDGLLMGYEISDLNLSCDLVVLSACETGRGQTVAGEGVLGLPRLFLGAGARSVLMTSWKVDDRFSAELVTEFYRQYLHRRLPKIDALAEAKRRLLNHFETQSGIYYQHPLYWAAFTIYGDPGIQSPASFTLIAGLVAIPAVLLISLFLGYRWTKARRTVKLS